MIDNLIADDKLQRTIAVFIDPRDPDLPSANRRASEYITNPDYSNFVAHELVPVIDANYRRPDWPTCAVTKVAVLTVFESPHVDGLSFNHQHPCQDRGRAFDDHELLFFRLQEISRIDGNNFPLLITEPH